MNNQKPNGSIRRRLIAQLGFIAALLSIIFVYSVRTVGESAAKLTQDNVLAAAATSILEALRSERGEIVIDIPYSAFAMLDSISEDRIYYRILVNDETLTGYASLPVDTQTIDYERPQFADDTFLGNQIRTVMVKRAMSVFGVSSDVVVAIAQTRSGFAKISSDILLIAAAIGTGFFILAILLCLFAAHNALQPLIAITRSVEKRGPQDLRPVPNAVPTEVFPLIVALNRFIKRLDKSLQNAEAFIADAAHRIRTPLAMVQINAEIALRIASEEPSRKALQAILSAAEETSRSAGQLLDHATISFRTENMQTETLDIAELVNASVNQFAPIAEMKSIIILIQLPDEPTFCTIDAIMLQSAIGNILDNAIKYSPADSTIHVRIDHLGAWCRITVTDQGRGFGELTPQHLTQRFERGNNVGNTLGSGLGLAIVMDVVNAHGGKIEISKNPEGAGSCFSVLLPL